jgi:cbb3-type cytochrome oxidase cytochrome c subunit
MPYLAKRDPKKYPVDPDGESAEARAALPPSLIGQGERTQTEWLYQFLLNPTKVRKLAILQMPKFNMSKDEARELVNYFAAVTRQVNPGIGLSYPLESIPQRDDIDRPDGYWAKKTAEYVARLKKMDAYDMDGKVIKGKNGKAMKAYEQRVAEYAPIWEKLSKQQEASIKADLKKLETVNDARKKDLEAKEKALKDKKDAELQKEVDALQAAIKDYPAEKQKLEGALKKLDAKNLQEAWEANEAYAADSYRMLTSRKLCAQCHQIGNIAPSEKDKQGPPLALANQRLRPGWVENWVNKPQRFVPYASLMPTYFSDREMKWQPLHAGVAREQLEAVRDVLMNFPRVAEMPINRLHNPDLPADKK